MVCGLWFVVCGLWFVLCGLWFVLCGSFFVVGGFEFTVWGLEVRAAPRPEIDPNPTPKDRKGLAVRGKERKRRFVVSGCGFRVSSFGVRIYRKRPNALKHARHWNTTGSGSQSTLSFKVEGQGSRVLGPGFRISGLGFGVSGFGFGIGTPQTPAPTEP